MLKKPACALTEKGNGG